MPNIMANFLPGKRFQLITDRDPFIQLPERRKRQQPKELRLSQQDDLDQLFPDGLQIRQHPDLLHHAVRKILRLVDQQHGVPPRGEIAQQKIIQRVEIPFLRCPSPLRPNAELLVDRLEQLDVGKGGVEDERRGDGIVQAGEQGTAKGRLARPDPAGDRHEPLFFMDPVNQAVQRLPVLRAQVQIPGIRGKGEGILPQTEIGFIHKDDPWGRGRGAFPSPFSY